MSGDDNPYVTVQVIVTVDEIETFDIAMYSLETGEQLERVVS